MARRRKKTWIDGEAGAWLPLGLGIGGLVLYMLMARPKRAVAASPTNGVRGLAAAPPCGPCGQRRA